MIRLLGGKMAKYKTNVETNDKIANENTPSVESSTRGRKGGQESRPYAELAKAHAQDINKCLLRVDEWMTKLERQSFSKHYPLTEKALDAIVLAEQTRHEAFLNKVSAFRSMQKGAAESVSVVDENAFVPKE